MEEQWRSCEDEIDLRELALTLWRGRWVIVTTTVVAALAALVVSLMLPRQYQASASVGLTVPKVQIAESEGLALRVRVPDLKTAASLAQAPEIWQQLAEQEEIRAAWRDEAQPVTWETLAERGSVKEQGKSGLQLLVKDTDPQRAALVANRWAALVVERLNERYGWAGLHAQLDPQVQRAWEAYQKAQTAYQEEVSKNRATVLQAQLDRAKGDLACVLSRASQLARLQQDVAAFSEYLQGLPGEEALAPGDALALVTLQQRVLALKSCVADTANLQFQWSAETLSALTVQEARGLTEELDGVIRQRLQALPAQQKDLEGEITRLQQALEEERARLREALRRRDTAWKAYHSLSALQAQSRALSSPENQVALPAAQAVVPVTPVAPRTRMNVALAGVLGAILSVMGVFVAGWWKDVAVEAK